VIGALLLPWIGVSAFYLNNGAAYSLNGLGSGSWSAQVSGSAASGSAPGLDQFELGLPSQVQTVMEAFRLLPIIAAIASVGVLLLVAAAWNGKYRGRGLGLVGTLAGIVAMAASGAWFFAVSAINNQVGTGGFTVSLVSVGPGIGLTFLAGLVLPLCALFGRAHPSAAAVVSVSAAQPQHV
jgi:hypothetical protein